MLGVNLFADMTYEGGASRAGNAREAGRQLPWEVQALQPRSVAWRGLRRLGVDNPHPLLGLASGFLPANAGPRGWTDPLHPVVHLGPLGRGLSVSVDFTTA